MFLFVNISKCRIGVIGKHVKKGVNLMYIARPFPNSLSFQVQYLSKNNNIKYDKLKQEYKCTIDISRSKYFLSVGT